MTNPKKTLRELFGNTPIPIDALARDLVDTYSLSTIIHHIATAAEDRALAIAELHEPRPKIAKNWHKAAKLLVDCQVAVSHLELEIY
jgi:hypothetical protein